MRATVRDVARLAGVSPKTVSNVVNGTVPVNPDTRERVEAAMATLDYVPNLSARGLRNGRSGLIALALPDLSTPYSAELVHEVVEAAHRHQLAIQLEETGYDPERELQLLTRARANLVDGLILNPLVLDQSAIAPRMVLPPAVILGEVQQNIVDAVGVDSVGAARAVTRMLAEQGRRRIAVLGARRPGAAATAETRTRGYREALAEAGLPWAPELEIICEDWHSEGGANALSQFLARHEPPDALFCFTDSLAYGALSVLASAGHSVPGDVSVAGFDDLAMSPYAVPALTSVRFSRRTMAEEAVRLLLEQIENRGRPPRTVMVPFSIQHRDSTGGANV
ncbi:LacI family transcriptional regulator [Sinomonas humi]|uniref:LacI family transcriptional regulator n=2 Tax=Sinomonas humi TaxID=1338436 RepID=A0A0B2ADE5_9MICC|nr:LacI family DNA-binding transcriptional regulator [Sinomonas humi]KHL01619.1 LacI family transcriptional regulator [Sinomonas humi]